MTGLQPGVYRIYWRDGGGVSLAAVGQLHDGRNWMAPCNWSTKFAEGAATASRWHMVEAYEIIEATP